LPRPQKCRRICREPDFTCFTPSGAEEGDQVILSLDEFEVIRLVDLEKKTHEQCAAQMEVSRTTVTEIYESARAKIADSLVNGRQLLISGGNYRLCSGESAKCCGGGCRKRELTAQRAAQMKGETTQMKIAVTYENGQIFQHFGHTETFAVYEVEDNKVVEKKLVSSGGTGHGALAYLLQETGVEVLICGGIGGGAQQALANAGIRLFGGVSGDADAAVQALLDGSLAYNPNVMCNHHGEGHHHDHDCGSHGHNCGDHGHDHHCGGHGHQCH